ncbi:hypothetical protein [Bradyrhizobium sp. SZCCHNRI1003]|uniref:hypothetical protein n=1 Tax=Bradyrhizobium sp. SZCCHNRI1003 TaxID=3057275 RepID=UPI0029170CAD|nr:hypothetical protein [Bradyrhizobium sp. SZCCHNRI1003]
MAAKAVSVCGALLTADDQHETDGEADWSWRLAADVLLIPNHAKVEEVVFSAVEKYCYVLV